MAKCARSEDLRAAFDKHHRETEGHVERLEEVFQLLEKKPQGKTCDAIVGITEEGAEIIKEYKVTPALDAGLLAAAQALRNLTLRHAQGLGREARHDGSCGAFGRDAGGKEGKG